MRVIPGRGCVCGVVGFMRAWSASCAPTVVVVSGKCVESPAVDGESPVRENTCSVVGLSPSSSGPVKSAVNLPGPSGKPEYFPMTDSGLVP